MNWNMILLLVMLYTLVKEGLQLKKGALRRDRIVFTLLWMMTFGVLLADWRGYPVIRPLDWIRAATWPLSRWLG